MVPLGNILTGFGLLGSLVMLPHLIVPAKMCKMFLADKFTDDKNAEAQLVFMHFGLFANLFFLAVSIAIAGQTCPTLPIAFFFAFIIAARLVHVLVGFKGRDAGLLGLGFKPVLLQCIAGGVIMVGVLVAATLAMYDEEYLAATATAQATAFDKMDDMAPLVYFIVSIALFFSLMSAPGMCVPDKMMDGYIPSALRLADKYAAAQMQFYMVFQSREQFFFWLLIAAMTVMSPNIVPVGIALCCMALFFVGVSIYGILNASSYGFKVAAMLVWTVLMSVVFGATALGLALLIYDLYD